ncbi:MAG: phosphate ABC transporter ATP-binding protein, partial [Microcystaceae cyanobacterium]
MNYDNDNDYLGSPQVLSIHNVDIFYGKYRAVRDVSLTIPKNQITAFIGPSG